MKKIEWHKLKESDEKMEFKRKVLEEIELEIDVQEWWAHNAAAVRRYGKEALGETSGKV